MDNTKRTRISERLNSYFESPGKFREENGWMHTDSIDMERSCYAAVYESDIVSIIFDSDKLLSEWSPSQVWRRVVELIDSACK